MAKKSMSIVKTRRLLTFLLTVTFVIGALMLFSTFIATSTLCKSGYMSKFICSSVVRNELDLTFEQRIDALSKQTGIPTDVFNKAKETFAESDNISVRFYRGYDTTLYSSDKVDTVKGYCAEYLTAVKASYTDEQIEAIAKKAVTIYDQTYGLENVHEAYGYIQDVKQVQSKIYSSSLLLMFGSALAMITFYSKKVDRQKALMSQFNATAFTFVLAPLLCLIFGIGTHVKVYPVIYASAIGNAVRADFVLMLIIGLIFTAISVFFTPKIFNKVSK